MRKSLICCMPQENPSQKKEETSARETNSTRIEEIRTIPLIGIRSIRRRLYRLLGKGIILLGVGGISGGIGGELTQNAYRQWSGYSPDQQEINASEKSNGKKNETHTKKQDSDEEKDKLDDETRQSKSEMAEKEIENDADEKPSKKRFWHAYREMKSMYNKMLAAGDDAAFGTPFVLLFLSTIILANKLIKLNKSLFKEIDADDLQENVTIIERKLNEIVSRMNTQGKTTALTPQTKKEILELFKQFEQVKKSMDV